ncbi:MAG: hypothetical protein ACRDZX_06240 [Acidimicrobiales bacterium]
MNRPAALFALVGGLALLAAGCGGGPPRAGVAHLGKSPTTTATLPPAAAGTAPAGPSTGRSAGLAFAQCMRSHGVPRFPDPGGSGGIQIIPGSGIDPTSPKFQAAQSACSKYLPNGGKVTPAQQQAAMARALEFSKCMRSHGMPNFPDPQAGPGGQGVALRVGRDSGINPSSAQFQAAQKTCQSIRGGPKGPNVVAP